MARGNAERLGLMKETAYLINTGRGLLVDEAALAHALRKGVIAGAGLDVLSSEPPPADNPLLDAPHCFITPHLAWATRAARQRLIDELAANLKAFLAGETRKTVTVEIVGDAIVEGDEQFYVDFAIVGAGATFAAVIMSAPECTARSSQALPYFVSPIWRNGRVLDARM